MVWKFLELISTLLEPSERQSVLGDIHERGPNARAVLDLLGLVLLRQSQAWTSWRPWAMGLSLALPAMFVGFSTHPIGMILHSGHLFSIESGAGTFLIQPWVALATPCYAWATGFALGRLGKRPAASVLPLAIAWFTWSAYTMALQSFRHPLPPLWSTRFQLTYSFTQDIATAIQRLDETARFTVTMLVVLLLTAAPCCLGFVRGLRNNRPHTLLAIIAIALCLLCLYPSLWFPGLRPTIRAMLALWPLLFVLGVSRKVSYAN